VLVLSTFGVLKLNTTVIARVASTVIWFSFSVFLILVSHIVKWAGGKGQLLSELDKMIPSQFNTYFERFPGDGAMFFYLVSNGMSFNAYLSDTNVELITAYRAVKDNVKEVIRLQKYDYEYKTYQPYSDEQKEYYFQLRDARNNNIKSSNRISAGILAEEADNY
jgi:site-specific DNA-adenine methylase